MNIILWILQILLGLYFLAIGVVHFIVPPDLPATLSWMYDLPAWLHWISGTAEILGGLGLILPGLAKIQTRLTPLAALGLALIMAGDNKGADDALTRALGLDENLVAAWYNRGLMALHAGNLAQAEADLAQAASLAPDNGEVANLLQQVMRQKRRQ